jgi:hypothetical protein
MNEVDSLLNVSPDSPLAGTKIRFRYRIALVLAAWLLTLFVMGPGMVMSPFGLMFPVGLFRIFSTDAGQRANELIPLGWTLYAAICVALLAISHKRTYIVLFLVLCGMLVVNVIGCRVMIGEAGQGGL